MPPREVICDLCGGKFFAHSLPIHRRTCEVKVQSQLHDCPYCGMAVTQLEMDAHVMSCKAAKAAGGKPTGQSAHLRQRLQPQDRRGSAAAASGRLQLSQNSGSQARLGHKDPYSAEKLSGNGAFRGACGGEASAFGAPDVNGAGAGLVPCRICGRTFSIDRVAKHQAICQKVNKVKKRPVFHSEKQRVFLEGGSSGKVVGAAAPLSKASAAMSSTRNRVGGAGRSFPGVPQNATNWREQSRAFREAMRAARGAPPRRSSSGRGNSGLGAPQSSSRSASNGLPRSRPRPQPAPSSMRNPSLGRASGSRAETSTGSVRNRLPPSGSSAVAGRAGSYGRGGQSGASLLSNSKASMAHAAAWHAAEATSLRPNSQEVPYRGAGPQSQAPRPRASSGGSPWGGGGGGLPIGNSNAVSANNPLAAFAGGGRSRW
eukprot:TRINITY_DN79067_c0_g1_i1.p1 TRINITY_DN79067_c0_g1~~TRINITY_DN79067_c0_g1_i1.p1  ORF type:complete len:428 (+),score=57.07 TRINITY_DN79067_c0_g1_i1:96-1379(+)